MATKQDVIKLLADLQVAYDYEPKNAPGLLNAWVRALRNADAAQFDAAYERTLSVRKWFPKVAEFLADVRWVQERGGRSPLEAEPSIDDEYWNSMTFLNKALRENIPNAHTDRRIAGHLKKRVATECDGLTPEELERLADERSGYSS